MFRRKNPAELQAQLASLKGGSSFSSDDKGEWKLKTDNAGNGSAVIRFLPGKGDEGLPFVKLINHGFKKNGKWYIENCTSTHGDYDSCPVCQHLSSNDSYNTNQEEYKLLKRKSSYWANILVLKDPAAPENEGKVFKYRFGQKIMDKINAEIEVDTDLGEVPVDVTCPFEGKHFSLKVKKVGGFTNYDDCKFGAQSEIPNINDEAYQKELDDGMVQLNDIVSKDKFKSYDVNHAKFVQIMGTSLVAGNAAAQADKLSDDLDAFDADMAAFDSKPKQQSAPLNTSSSDDDGDLDDLLAGL